MSLIDISQPTIVSPIRVMVDAEDGVEVLLLSLMDGEGQEWLRYSFAAVTGYVHCWLADERQIITAPLTLGPLHTAGRTQVTTMDVNDSRSVRRWVFPRVKARIT